MLSEEVLHFFGILYVTEGKVQNSIIISARVIQHSFPYLEDSGFIVRFIETLIYVILWS
jgi:hypothetical protein